MSDETKSSMPLVKFGKWLAFCRVKADVGNQSEVVAFLKQRGIKASQGLIAQYETGRIADPKPKILRGLAELYQVPFVELLHRLMTEKYCLTNEEARELVPLPLIDQKPDQNVQITLQGTTEELLKLAQALKFTS